MKTLFIGLSAALFLIPATARAQLVPDRTLGRESSVVVPVSNTRDDISGGARRGSNLFHSFSEFNVNTGRSVYFNNPSGVRNIINRVTGSQVSNIFGTLGVSGNANLYLINPNGIVFGDGAFLDINGTFIGTTADGVRLGANDVYSASDPGQSSLLTIRPEALFVNRKNAQIRAIRNQGNLEVKPGGNLTLSGDIVENNGAIAASGGNVFLSADRLDLKGQPLQNFLSINTSSASGNSGNITLIAKDKITLNNSFILGDSFGAGQSSNINIQARSIELVDSAISSNLQETATGNGGNISIKTEKLTLNGDIVISTANLSNNLNSVGGDINISATESIEYIGTQNKVAQTIANGLQSGNFDISDISSFITTVTDGKGQGGNLTINTGKLLVQKAIISTGTINNGNGGKLNINATDRIELIDAALWSTAASAGNAEDATINTGTLILRDGSQISTNTLGDGNAGNMFITATESVELSSDLVDDLFPSGLFASTIGAKGNAGNITVNTRRLIVQDGTEINVITGSNNPFFGGLGQPGGRGGNIKINATESITVSGITKVTDSSDLIPQPSVITTETYNNFRGGDITIFTGKFSLAGGAQISTATFFTGDAGNLNIVADEIDIRGAEVQFDPNISVSGTGIFALAQKRENLDTNIISGTGGDINLTANTLTLRDKASISAQTNSSFGGDITISLSDRLVLRENSTISATGGVDNGAGNGGNITIDSPFIFAFPRNNKIVANAFSGNGGNININSSAIFGYPQFLAIDASSELGIDGTINITGVTDLNSDILPAEPVTITTTPPQIARCPIQGQPTELNSAIGDGTGEKIKLELFRRKNSDPKEEQQQQPESKSKPSKPAVGWYRKTDGTVVLTDNPALVRPLNQPIDYPPGCGN